MLTHQVCWEKKRNSRKQQALSYPDQTLFVECSTIFPFLKSLSNSHFSGKLFRAWFLCQVYSLKCLLGLLQKIHEITRLPAGAISFTVLDCHVTIRQFFLNTLEGTRSLLSQEKIHWCYSTQYIKIVLKWVPPFAMAVIFHLAESVVIALPGRLWDFQVAKMWCKWQHWCPVALIPKRFVKYIT